MKLDYSLKTAGERRDFAQGVVDEGMGASHPDLSVQDLSYLADYMLFVNDSGTTKGERAQEYPIETRNRSVTHSSRLVSYEDVTSTGSEFAYGYVPTPDTGVVRGTPIADVDLDEVPGMRDKAEFIASLEDKLPHATGRRKYDLKSQIIAAYKDQHAMRSSWNGEPLRTSRQSAHVKMPRVPHMPPSDVVVDDEGFPHAAPGSVSLLEPEHVAAMLDAFADTIVSTGAAMDSEVSLAVMDLVSLVERALKEAHPELYEVVLLKVLRYTNEEIAVHIRQKYGIDHNPGYYSTLWKRRIPKMVARRAQEEYIMRHHDEMGFSNWKICPRCGRALLAHPAFFSKNTSKDGYYSICRSCRSKSEQQLPLRSSDDELGRSCRSKGEQQLLRDPSDDGSGRSCRSDDTEGRSSNA